MFTHQTHTTNVRVVTEADKGCGIVKPRTYSDVDGLVTDIPGNLSGSILCGLRSFVFCGSGKESDRTESFRMERNRRKDRKGDCGNDVQRI